MKRYMKLISACVLAGLLTGCGTFQWTQTGEVNRLQSLARVASFTGSALYLSNHPEDTAKFVLARQAIEALLGGPTVDPIALRETLANLPIKELRAQQTAIIITAALLMVEELGSVTPAENNTQAKSLAIGIRDGLDLALKTVTPAGVATQPPK